MTLSHFEQLVGHWRCPDAGPREARDHRGEIVSTIEAVLEFGEVAWRVLAADGPIGAGCQEPSWKGLIDSWCKGGRVGGSR
jgi:hypothetical protein